MVKQITGSPEEELSELFNDKEAEQVTVVEFDDGFEMNAESLPDKLNREPRRVRNELDEGYTVYEEHYSAVRTSYSKKMKHLSLSTR